MKNTNTRVRWTDNEKRTIAAELVRRRAADPKLGNLPALVQAQALLPESRRRQVPAWIGQSTVADAADLAGARPA